MYKLYACCNIHNVIARELSKLHSSALHVHTARHEDRMYAMDGALVGNSRVALQISQETVLGHAWNVKFKLSCTVA